MEGTIGEIRLFAANFAPRNWWYCDGTLIAIRSNTALFSILGTTYGGDGKVTFGLPDLCGRAAIGAGQGPGLSYYDLGEQQGANTVTLNSLTLAAHNHSASTTVAFPAYSDSGDSNSPLGNILASGTKLYSTNPGDTGLKPLVGHATLNVTGGTTPFSIMEPAMGMNYIVCLTGIFPARD